MDMPFGNDHTSLQCNRSVWTDQRTAGRSLQITGLTDHARNTESSCVSYGNFNLCLFSVWTQHNYFFQLPFWTDNTKSFFTGILSGLTQFFHIGHVRACAKKYLKIFF